MRLMKRRKSLGGLAAPECYKGGIRRGEAWRLMYVRSGSYQYKERGSNYATKSLWCTQLMAVFPISPKLD